MKMPISGIGSLLKTNKIFFRYCYTLSELIAATAILLVLLALGTARLRSDWFAESPHAKMEQFRRIAALCRRRAAATGKKCCIEFDPGKRKLIWQKEQILFPEEFHLRRNGKEPLDAGPFLCFFPDGKALETEISFEYNDDVATLQISPLTGSMVIDETE